mgnify:CR=1 FL=1
MSNSTQWVIHKSTREPGFASYSGPTWDNVRERGNFGIRHLYQETYSDKAEALRIAAMLATANPVGFEVSPVINN